MTPGDGATAADGQVFAQSRSLRATQTPRDAEHGQSACAYKVSPTIIPILSVVVAVA